jgi:hypothetical protein
MRRISQESFEDQVVLRSIRPNRWKADKQHQWVRRKWIAMTKAITRKVGDGQ